jgi:hypothetical protein
MNKLDPAFMELLSNPPRIYSNQIAGAARMALQEAAAGGQLLYVYKLSEASPNRKNHLRGAGHRAHLFDRDLKRLKETARMLGIRRVKIIQTKTGENGNTAQFVKLADRPLERALALFGTSFQSTSGSVAG